MTSRGGRNPRPYTATPPSSRRTQDRIPMDIAIVHLRASQGGQYQRPSTPTPQVYRRTQDRRQDHITKEDMDKIKKGVKEQAEKPANLLHQPHNTVDLRDVEENLPKGDHEQSTKEVEQVCNKMKEKHEKETDILIKLIDRLEREKEDLLKRGLEQSTKEMENLRKDLNKIHEKERAHLLEIIDRLHVENDILLKSKMESEEKQLFPVKSTDIIVPQKILVATGRAKRMLPGAADKNNELEKMKTSQFKMESDEKQLFPVKSTDSFVPQNILVATGRAKRMLPDAADKNNELEKMKTSQLLSTIAADRLTHENPNIADLSDRDRPTKLQEVYEELYDNEWTDAFEELTMDKYILEKDAIGILLKIIMNSFHNCRKVTWGRYEALVNVASSIHLEKETPLSCTEKKGAENNKTSWDLTTSEEDNMKENNANIDTGSNGKEDAAKQVKHSMQLNDDILHALKRIWKMTSSELKGSSVESIYSVFVTNLDIPFESMPNTSKYLKSCIDLCWRMGVQEMPLHLEAIDEIDVKAGKKFDKDKFRYFTKFGEKVDFVVWPALYLHEGGPLLRKGVAQGC